MLYDVMLPQIHTTLNRSSSSKCCDSKIHDFIKNTHTSYSTWE